MRALLALLTLSSAALAAPETTTTLTGLHAAHPPHCMSENQWQNPTADAPFALFDGTSSRAWVICPEAAAPGYAVDFTFADATRIDALRLHPGASGTNHPTLIEIGLHNTQLSTRYPVHFRQVKLNGSTPVEISFQGRLPWNPRLVEDETFAERRRALGLSEHDVPLPITFDKITVVLRAVDASAGPVHIGELSFRLRDQPVPVRGITKVAAAHQVFVQKGLEHVLSGRYLVGTNKVMHLNPDGRILDILRPDWDSGKWRDANQAEVAGQWQIHAGRLEMKASPREPWAPVEYRIDDAPQRVELRSGPAAGTYKVVLTPPGPGAAPAKATAVAPAPDEASDDFIPIP